ncbi:MAG: aminotransferase class III-fold pyridoxal phosphate-dependent enzyme [Victivallales bacterium]
MDPTAHVSSANSGAEANEALIKLARKNGSEKGRCEIIVMNDSFHGRTLATLAATFQIPQACTLLSRCPVSVVNYNDIEAVRNAIDGKTAAVRP